MGRSLIAVTFDTGEEERGMLLKTFSDKKWLGDTIFGVTYQQQAGQSATGASHGR